MLQLDAGGSERVVLDLAKHIDKSVFDVYVALILCRKTIGLSNGLPNTNRGFYQPNQRRRTKWPVPRTKIGAFLKQ